LGKTNEIIRKNLIVEVGGKGNYIENCGGIKKTAGGMTESLPISPPMKN
jgi:hypothetical protein